jgi:VanZ family protein
LPLALTESGLPTPERKSRLSFDLALAVSYVVAIFVVGSLPGGPEIVRQVSDKLGHAVGFGLLAFAWCRALRALGPSASLAKIALGGFAVSVAVGGALELWQALLSYRTCEFLDWIADTFGAGVAAGSYAIAARWFGGRVRALE